MIMFEDISDPVKRAIAIADWEENIRHDDRIDYLFIPEDQEKEVDFEEGALKFLKKERDKNKCSK